MSKQPDFEPTKEQISVSEDAIEQMWADSKASMQGHNWIQYGTQVRCDTCPFNHGFYIEPGKILKGIDNQGYPIIDNIQNSDV
jgi:hypothetical protein